MALKTTDIPGPIRSFWKLFDRICYRHDYARVFDNFIVILLTQFTPKGELVDSWHAEAIKPYDEKEKDYINQSYYEFLRVWLKESEGGWYDFLGTLYEAITSGYKPSSLGQFFTPPDLCEIMAHFTPCDKEGATVNDPACGSGRTLLAHHKIYKKFDCIYLAEDRDPICVRMTAINMALHGLRGEVICHDTLCEMDSLRFGFHVNSLTHYRNAGVPHIVPIEEKDSIILGINANRIEAIKSQSGISEAEAKEKLKEERRQQNSQQLNLFD